MRGTSRTSGTAPSSATEDTRHTGDDSVSLILRKVYRIAIFLCNLSLILMMGQIFLDICARLFFGGLIPGTQELVGFYYMVMAVYVGIFVTEVAGEHISTDVLVHLFPERWQHVVDVGNRILGVAFFSVFTYALLLVALEQTADGEHVDAIWFDLTVWPTRWVAAAGCALTVVVMLLGRSRFTKDAAASGQEN